MRPTPSTFIEPLREITGGRLDLTIRMIEEAARVAASLGDARPSLEPFEAVVDRSPSIVRGSMGNPFRRH
jgi:hypothetical protein